MTWVNVGIIVALVAAFLAIALLTLPKARRRGRARRPDDRL